MGGSGNSFYRLLFAALFLALAVSWSTSAVGAETGSGSSDRAVAEQASSPMPRAIVAARTDGLKSSTELITNAKKYDGDIVAYEGEVVGDVMFRGAQAWINVYDGTNALGVWVPAALARRVRLVGGYSYIGDTVRVTGVFKRADARHGGDTDIHAETLRVVKAGRRTNHPFNVRRAVLAGALALLSLGIFLANRYRRSAR